MKLGLSVLHIRHIHLTMHQTTIIFWEIRKIVENFLALKTAEIY